MSDLMTPTDYLAMPEMPADLRIAYGDGPDRFGDLFLPDGRAGAGPHPVVLLVHGGCWRDRFGLAPLGQIARRLADAGIAVWNLEYRRLGGAGGWPRTFLDVAAGADRLRALAGDHPLDLDRVVAVGHSAGGHLALWLAGRRRLAQGAELWSESPLGLRAAVSLAGIADLDAALAEGVCGGAPGELMGGSAAEQPERYAQGSPSALMPLGIAYWQIVGESDALVPADYVRRCHEHARARGDQCGLTVVPDAGHFEIVDARSPAWPRVQERIESFL